ncbi:capsular polysaccharide biosynthesis protein [Bacteroidia bacterium]|nr:capsular polysaccharide biosynthesis protein [Bacteroidia bacterium]
MARLILLITWFSIHTAFAQEVTLLFAGDAMQHQSQIDNAFRNNTYDYTTYFQYIKNEVSSADLAIVNLEVTLAGKPYKGYPQFSAPDEYASALKEAGFDVFLNANNHIVDRGNQGIIRTLSVLDSLDVDHTGVFRNKEEREQIYPLMLERENMHFAFLNYTYGTNGLNVLPPVLVNYIDKEQILEDIQKAKNLNADLIIANMHWGVEYKLMPNKIQKDLADFLIKEGVDLVVGAHPHVVQPSEVLTDSTGNISHVIVYSLGNMISGMTAPNTNGGQMVKVIVEKQDGKIQIKSAEYTLIYSHKAKEKGKLNYTIVPVGPAEKNDSEEKAEIELDTNTYLKMKQFAKNARAVLDKNNKGVPEYKPLF